VTVSSVGSGTVDPMQFIYVHGSAALDADSAERLAHLAEAGHDLVLVAERDHPAADLRDWSERVEALPADPPRGSWYITSDPAACVDRRPGLRTMLIGPRETTTRPTRCDVTARDLRDAVLKVLAADVMS
jgi:hypothetical protein